MSHLRLTLQQGIGEAPADFASRLAFRNGRDDARAFCYDLGMSLQGIADGDAAEIKKLAEISSVDVNGLFNEAFFREGKRYVHKGQFLVANSMTRDRVRICPHCVAHDLEKGNIRPEARPYRRSHWIIDAIRTCPVHKMPLIDIGLGSKWTSMFDTSAAITSVLPDLSRIMGRTMGRKPSQFETYITDRLEGERSDAVSENWLDGLPLYAAMKLCEVIGAVSIHGARARLRGLDKKQLWQCDVVGFEITSQGESGIRHFLETCQGAAIAGRGEWGTRRIYGRLYEWLAHETDDPAYDPVRDIFWHHIVETLPIGTDEEIMGRRLERRLVHSVHSAAKEFGLHPKRLRRVLLQAGLISAEDTRGLYDERVVFSARKAKPLLDDLSESMSLDMVRDYANIPRPHDRIVYENGFITPIITGGTDTLKGHAFRRQDIDAFLRRLLADADPAYDGQAEFHDIPSAAKRTCSRAERIIRLLLDRKLKRVGRRMDVGDYLSVLVDIDEVRPLVIGDDHGGINLRTATQCIRTSDRVMKSLIEHGHLAAEHVKNPVTKQIQTIVRPREMERFQREFVGLHVLAEERYEHFRRTKAEMEARKIRPAFDPKVVMATFYRREDLQT